MPDETPVPPPSPEPEAPPQAPIPFNIGEEFGTARKNLPPTRVLVMAVGAVVVVIAIAAFFLRSKSSASGTIDDVVAVEIPNQNSVMVAVNLSVRNNGSKPYKITEITSDLQSRDKTYNDTAASKMDLDRYFQTLPALKDHALAPLSVEDSIEPGAEVKGTIIVSFPVTPDDFARRGSLKVSISGKDEHVPLELVK